MKTLKTENAKKIEVTENMHDILTDLQLLVKQIQIATESQNAKADFEHHQPIQIRSNLLLAQSQTASQPAINL